MSLHLSHFKDDVLHGTHTTKYHQEMNYHTYKGEKWSANFQEMLCCQIIIFQDTKLQSSSPMAEKISSILLTNILINNYQLISTRKQMLFIKEYLITQSDGFNTLLILFFQQWVHLSISYEGILQETIYITKHFWYTYKSTNIESCFLQLIKRTLTCADPKHLFPHKS